MTTPNSVRDTAATARYAMLQDHRKAGRSGTSTEAWTTFLNTDKAHNDALSGTPKHSDKNALAHAYNQLLRMHSVDIHTRIMVEKNRLQTEAFLAQDPITERIRRPELGDAHGVWRH